MHARLLRQLSQIDWDFVTGDETEAGGIHWYPGSFVPGLPGALIEALTKPNDIVFDPYGGAGATGIAAVSRGRGIICCDLNPIAVLSSYTAILLLALKVSRERLFDIVFGELEDLLSTQSGPQATLFLRATVPAKDIDQLVSSYSDRTAADIYKQIRKGPPDVECLRPWYERRTLSNLLAILERVQSYRDSAFIRLVGLAMVSAIARTLSSQTRSWGHIADNVLPDALEAKDVYQAARNWLLRTRRRIGRVRQLGSLPVSRPFVRPRLIDWARVRARELPHSSARLLITSPPYAGAIDYMYAQRLSLYLFGYSDDAVSALSLREIGARRRRSTDARIALWAQQLSDFLGDQIAVLDRDALAAFVMPHKDAGRDLGVEALRRRMRELGWKIAFERDRSIRQARARQSWTSIKRETILLFEQ